MDQTLKEALAKLGIQIEESTNLNIETIEVVVERDRTDVGH